MLYFMCMLLYSTVTMLCYNEYVLFYICSMQY